MFRDQNIFVMTNNDTCILRVELHLYFDAHYSFLEHITQHLENTFQQFHFNFQVQIWYPINHYT